jgi:hypothetical protein
MWRPPRRQQAGFEIRPLVLPTMVEDQADMKASLEISPTGSTRLTLDTAVAPCSTRHR